MEQNFQNAHLLIVSAIINRAEVLNWFFKKI